ncbi:NAD(P)H-dependent oxidoreductase [Pelistega europaea]|uniref:NAD(P)H-dependent oxidoreductase n=1 Tax=Pelistega europaea TaxID=106147 RepID=A0A7Y4P5J2_9BURK|nr:NAD(P)H-dependent oxidoreductase [Pelistega europaea]NOL48914.1 NAD(P)H-dependent oxidoreductase [Pelistega europaea]
MNAQDVLQPFQFRYACKKFNAEKKISENDFRTILEAGRLSPSSFGYEPWKFLIVQDSQLKEKLYPVAWGAQRSFNGASHFVILLARKKKDIRYGAAYLDHIMKDIKHLPDEVMARMRELLKNWQLNDFNLGEDERALFDWASKQTYIAMANMMTAAAMMGIDSCPIEGFNRQAVEDILIQNNALDPEHFGVSVMVSFGYRDETQPAKTRQSLEDIVQWIE